MGASNLRIGEVAGRAGIAVDTIRYYERIGLLPRLERTRSGYRSFGPDSVERLRFIQRAQELGFSLAEIGDLLALRVRKGSPCGEVSARARERLAVIERKLERLRRMRHALRDLLAACASDTSTSECPILEALSREEEEEEEDDD